MSGRAKPARPQSKRTPRKPAATQHHYTVTAYAANPGRCGRCGEPADHPSHLAPTRGG